MDGEQKVFCRKRGKSKFFVSSGWAYEVKLNMSLRTFSKILTRRRGGHKG